MGWSFASFLKPGMMENSVIGILSLHQKGRSAKIAFWHGNKYTLAVLKYILDNSSVHQNHTFKVTFFFFFFNPKIFLWLNIPVIETHIP